MINSGIRYLPSDSETFRIQIWILVHKRAATALLNLTPGSVDVINAEFDHF
jgi:hypothetical protein